MFLQSKLPEMMVGVEITEPHPFAGGHCPEIGMVGPREIVRELHEGMDSTFQFVDIVGEINGACATLQLVDLWKCFETPRPLDRDIQA